MTESSFPFQGQPVAMASAAPEPEPEIGQGNRTKLMAVGGIAVVVALSLVVYFLGFVGGGDEVDEGPVAGPKPAAVAPVVPEAGSAPAKEVRFSAKSFGRNPFKALITEPVAAVAPSSTTSAVAAAPTGATDPGAATDPGTSVPAASTTHTFRVVTVAPDNSSVDVKLDGKLHRNLKAGEVFGTYFKVILISGQVNSFQFGEEKFNVSGTKRLTIA